MSEWVINWSGRYDTLLIKRHPVYFAFPLALSLLVLLGILWLPRRPRHTFVGNLPVVGAWPRPPWYRYLPTWLLTLFMAVLIVLIAEPMGGTQEFYTVQESRRILLLIDASASMEGAPIQAAKAVAEAFIQKRPSSDRLGVVLFSDVASGGIMTRNHTGLIKELQRQEGIRISGTQLGIGLFKSLSSFIEDTVETALWHDRNLSEAQRHQRFQQALDEIARLGRHLLSKTGGEFVLHLPEIPDQRQLGAGSVLIVLSDARVHHDRSYKEIMDHRQVLHLYETMGFERLYFISVDALPAHLIPVFDRRPNWRFLRIRHMADHRQLAQAYAEIDRLESANSHLESRLLPRSLYPYGIPALLLLPLALTLQLMPRFRSLI